MKPLVIPFFYESFSLYQSRGYSFEDCIELDKDETIDAIVQSLRKNGFDVVPVGDIKELVHCIAKGEHEKWDLAFSISEGMHGAGREAQIPGLLEAYQISHVFPMRQLSLCLDKGKTEVSCHRSSKGSLQHRHVRWCSNTWASRLLHSLSSLRHSPSKKVSRRSWNKVAMSRS